MILDQQQQSWFDYQVKYLEKQKKSKIKINPKTDFQIIQKKLLKNLNLLTSNIHKIKIYISILFKNSQLPYKILLLNTHDFINIANRQLKYNRSIKLQIQSSEQLYSKKKRQPKTKVQFDSEGQIQSIQQEYQLVTPSNPPYRGKTQIQCVFCHRSSKLKQYIKLNGPFYGPFVNKSYCHLLCAIWSPQIYLNNQNNQLMNVNKQIKRCERISCSYCKQLGGGLGCKERSCKVSAHFDCALKNDCQLDWQTYQLLCKSCLSKKILKIQKYNEL